MFYTLLIIIIIVVKIKYFRFYMPFTNFLQSPIYYILSLILILIKKILLLNDTSISSDPVTNAAFKQERDDSNCFLFDKEVDGFFEIDCIADICGAVKSEKDIYGRRE